MADSDRSLGHSGNAGKKLLLYVGMSRGDAAESKIPGLYFQHVGISHADNRRVLIVPFNGTFKAEQARLAVVEKACLLGGHYHDSAELFFVISGLALFTVEAVDPPNTREFYTLNPGDLLYVPARVGHLAQVTSGTILQTFTEKKYTTSCEYDNVYAPLRSITEAGVEHAGLLYKSSLNANAQPQSPSPSARLGGTLLTDFLITGGSGFVGANLARALGSKGSVVVAYFQTPAPDEFESVPMDVRDETAVAAIWDIKPGTVVHVAGNKNVKFCEENPEEATRINSLGTWNVARACRRAGSKMVYISTDVVFDCSRGGYRESDIPRPNLVYGKTKLEGEQRARAECPDAAICRTGGVYGKNSPLLRWLARELSEGRPVKSFTDVVNTPTYVDNLAEMIEAVIRKNLSGVFHMVGSQRVSRYQLFLSYARAFGLDEALVRPEAAGESRAGMLLQADSSLSIAKTAPLLGVPFNSVDEGLERLRRAGGV